jgi:alkanesulfonate monooxygenase SsuD/methylene tetrahydromethanopterin reductase-like flavin-dependent oxidoreductase (luciferase family)
MNGLGLALSARAALPAAEYAEFAARAENAGYDAVFVTETASDSLSIAQSMIHATDRIMVGTAISNIYWRHPTLMGVSAAALSRLSGGRFALGLGTGNPALNHDRLGLPRSPPVATMREYVAVLRSVLRGGEVTFAGEVYRTEGFRDQMGPSPEVPLYVGAMQARMTRVAAALGDGVLLTLMSRSAVAASVADVRQAARDAGRAPEEVKILGVIPVVDDADPKAAIQAARGVVAGYALHPAARRVFAGADLGATDLAEVASAAAAGDPIAAAHRIDERFARDLVVLGDFDERVQFYRDVGVDMPVLFPMAVNGEWRQAFESTLRIVS